MNTCSLMRTMRGQMLDELGKNYVMAARAKGLKAKAIRFATLEAICRELNCQPGDLLEYRED